MQWLHGRLEPETLQQTLALIDSGAALTRWQPGLRDFAKRRAVLEKFRTQITSSQPVAKKVRKPILVSCDWPVGTVIAYRLLSGNLAMILVIGHSIDKGELLQFVSCLIGPERICLRRNACARPR